MIITNTKRIIKQGFIHFWRNGFVSLSSVSILTLSLIVFSSVIFLNVLGNTYLNEIKDKVDINIYFDPNVAESDIIELKSELEAMGEIKEISYTSREVALAKFKENHIGDELIMQSLDELNQNPLPASLNIKAKDPRNYDNIIKFLEKNNSVLSKDGKKVIKDTYRKNEKVIERIGKILAIAEKAGFFMTLILIILSSLITFNTIRLIIHISRDEIAVMRLVGASNTFVRLPFVVSGLICGVISSVITISLLYPITFYVGKSISNSFASSNLLGYYLAHIGEIFLVIFTSSIILSGVSSFLAVKKYLKV